MSRSIKVSQQTYERLLNFQRKRETFDQAVARLLAIHEVAGNLATIIEGNIAFREGQRERLEKATSLD